MSKDWRRAAFAAGFAVYSAAVGLLPRVGDAGGGLGLLDLALLGVALLMGYWLWPRVEAAAAPGSPLRPSRPRMTGAVIGGALGAAVAVLLVSLAGGDADLVRTVIRGAQIGAAGAYLAWPLVERGRAGRGRV